MVDNSNNGLFFNPNIRAVNHVVSYVRWNGHFALKCSQSMKYLFLTFFYNYVYLRIL